MKGIIFLKPLEYNVEAIGERWRQGDKIKGTLTLKNHSADKIELSFLKIKLAEGNYKKIKAKDAKAWSTLNESLLCDAVTVGPSADQNYSFEFVIPETSPITDKNGSLYLAFYDKDDTQPAGHIELVIEPKQTIQYVLQVFENFARFKVKEIKNGKKSVEVKLMPPASRETSNIDSLILSLAESDKTLSLNYQFNLRGIDLSSGTMQTQKITKEIEQKFTSKQYMMYDSPNQDFILSSIQTVLDEVKLKLL
jgi:hypothetical protein